jgi:hypothetical protein
MVKPIHKIIVINGKRHKNKRKRFYSSNKEGGQFEFGKESVCLYKIWDVIFSWNFVSTNLQKFAVILGRMQTFRCH